MYSILEIFSILIFFMTLSVYDTSQVSMSYIAGQYLIYHRSIYHISNVNISIFHQYFLFSSDRTQYICEKCGKNFPTHNGLKIHSMVHTNYLKKACKICGKKIRCMNRHMLTHTEGRLHICHVCAKLFKSEFALKV